MADEHPIDVEAVEKEGEIQQVYELSALQVSDDQLLGVFKLEKEENSRERVLLMTKIQRVPEIIKLRSEDFTAYYMPMELSIGPIHASDPNLFKMELKLRLAAEFIKHSEQWVERVFERLLWIIQENIQNRHIPYCKGEYNPVHLLDLLQFVLSSSRNGQMRDYGNNCLEHSCCFPLLSCGVIVAVFVSVFTYLTNPAYREHSFRSVQELKAAGIKLKPSDSCSLRSVSFQKRFCFRGHLKLPPLVVDGSMACKLLNLLAYEMCHPEYETNCIVASYGSLLDLLIANEDDVKDLRAADIIRNRLCSDVEVAKLFDSLRSICIARPCDSYKDVKSDIEKHYKRKLVIWMAQFYRVHFSSLGPS